MPSPDPNEGAGEATEADSALVKREDRVDLVGSEEVAFAGGSINPIEEPGLKPAATPRGERSG
jgi:hypothetical protein